MSTAARAGTVTAAWWVRLLPDRRTRRLLVSALPIVIFAVVAVVAPLVVPYNHIHTDLPDRLRPPGAILSNGAFALFGTDQVGRDIAGQVLYGARISLTVGFATVAIAGTLGSAIGIAAGFIGGPVDALAMRTADVQLSLPAFLLAIFVAAVIGPSVTNVIVILALTRWVVFARVARSATLAVKEREFVDSARVLGATGLRIVVHHIVPATLTPLLVVATTQFGLVVLAEASLSFLGLGVPLSVPSWGQTIANGRDYLATAWWISTLPGLVLALVTISFGWFGDALRDHLDPHLRTQ